MTDKELLKTITLFRREFLGRKKPDLMCMALSEALQKHLFNLGVETELICGEIEIFYSNDLKPETAYINHWWLELPDKRIIDGTGSQFNKCMPSDKQIPRVYFGVKPDWYIIPELAF